MKQVIYSALTTLLFAFVVSSCSDEGVAPKKDLTSGSGSGNTSARVAGAPGFVYGITSSSTDGYTWTFVIDQSAAHDISHLIFQGTGCDGSSATAGNITAASVNGQDWMGQVSGVTGNGDVCLPYLTGSYIKLDNFNFSGGSVTVVVTFDTQIASGAFLIKSATKCIGMGDLNYAFSHDCTPAPTCGQDETAWATGPRYVSRGNWGTYTPYQAGSVNVYAGQNMFAGTATMSAVSGGNVTITIALEAGWSFQNVSEPVKIMNYSSAPSGNPSPGRFSFKGTSLTVTVPAANFYGIHLDVQKAVACN